MASHASSCDSSTYSSALCATSMLPGPQISTDVCAHSCWNNPPSVPKAALTSGVSGGSHEASSVTASEASAVARPG
ncbi:hypothetical protein G6F23_015830 [Rhizopus arrhizus]|nr:hypothetical protein G6F23_015830 [Rhizopus arrhizus]